MTFTSKEELIQQLEKEMVKAGIPQSARLFKKYSAYRPAINYLYFYCNYCSAKIACQVMHEDGKVLVTSINANHVHTNHKFQSEAEENIYRVKKNQRQRT